MACLLVPLCPDSEDVLGKRVIIKVDSVPGWLNVEILANLWMLCHCLYPGVPNTTAVT